MTELVAALRDEIATERRPSEREPDRLMSIEQAARALGIGRTALYSEIGAGRIRSVKVGRRRLVPSSAISEVASGASDRSDAQWVLSFSLPRPSLAALGPARRRPPAEGLESRAHRRPRVMAIEAWPSASLTVFNGTPWASIRLAALCRRSWNRTG